MFAGVYIQAQSAKLKTPNVIVLSDGNLKAIPKEMLTSMIYTDDKGKKWNVYKTSSGKLFIKKISPKTGKEYRYYLITSVS